MSRYEAGSVTSFFLSALEQIPSIGIKIRALQSSEDTTEVLSGKYHAYILPREPRPDRKLDVRPLFRERLVLGCAAQHPLASADVVRAEELVEFPYIDRLKCEFRDQIQEHFARREVVMRPRFRTEREDRMQRVVADGLSTMGRLDQDQGKLFYSFCLDNVVPNIHRVREIAGVLDLSWSAKKLALTTLQRCPSIAPVLILGMLIVGYRPANATCLLICIIEFPLIWFL